MNSSHHRHLVASLRYIDSLLAEAKRSLAVGDPESPFTEFKLDVSPEQSKVINDHIRRVLDVIVQTMARLDLPAPAPQAGTLRTVQTNALGARIAVTEMNARRLCAYGALSDVDAAVMDSLAAELDAALGAIVSYLDQEGGADLPMPVKI